jgi:hypothetical protein
MLLYLLVDSTRNYDELKPSPDTYLEKLTQEVGLPKEQLVKFKEECIATLESKAKVVISVNFGEKTLTQSYRDEVNGEIVSMVI